MDKQNTQSNSKQSNKVVLNTTINQKIYNDFRDECKRLNCSMNMVLEIFMKQFANGEFAIKITRGEQTMEIEE